MVDEGSFTSAYLSEITTKKTSGGQEAIDGLASVGGVSLMGYLLRWPSHMVGRIKSEGSEAYL